MKRKIVFFGVAIIFIIAIAILLTYEKRKDNLEYSFNSNENGLNSNLNNEYITLINSVQNDLILENNPNEFILTNDDLGILNIPKIDIRAAVREGSNSQVLKRYIGHIEGTALYDGNVCLAAHNRGNKYSYFADIDKLEIGDEIIYQTKYGIKKYRVSRKETIKETDWNMLSNTEDNRLTLITCIANKKDLRMCVQAIEYKEVNE